MAALTRAVSFVHKRVAPCVCNKCNAVSGAFTPRTNGQERRCAVAARNSSFSFNTLSRQVAAPLVRSRMPYSRDSQRLRCSVATPEDTSEGETFTYQAEVDKLMDLIVNSLYSTKEIFLRELVSNASDALDKIRFKSVQDPSALGSNTNLAIKIQGSVDDKTLTIEDNGIGMSRDEIVDSLGTIAKSGTAKFMEALKEQQQASDSNLIGQFGVGFYSAFLVADKITVITKSNNDGKTWLWESQQGSHQYSIRESPEQLDRGTRIILSLKEEAHEFAEDARLKDLVKQYSQFISFPIQVWGKEVVSNQVLDEEATAKKKEEEKKKAEEEEKEFDESSVEPVMKTETEDVWDFRVENDDKPLWVRSPREVTDEEYNAFFKATFKEFMDAEAHTHFKAEGDIEFSSMLFIPGMAPFEQQDMGTKSRNIKLYVKRVFISDGFDEDLMPRWLSFVKGIVDSSDLPLNVSREILQESRVVRVMRKRLVKKTMDMLKNLAKEDEEKYAKFFENFGKNLKLGIIEDQTNRDAIAKLLRFETNKSEGKLTSLDGYVERMKENQKDIYFLASLSKEAAANAPFMEGMTKRGYEVLYLTEPIDEVAITNLQKYGDHNLVDISKEDIDLGLTDEEKAAEEEQAKEFSQLVDWLKNTLGDKVEKVVISNRLGSSPCVLSTSKFGWSASMERIMRAQAMGDNAALEYMRGRKILELNPDAPIVKAMKDQCGSPTDDTKELAELMFDTAMLTSGFQIDEPAALGSRVFQLMNKVAGVPLEAVSEPAVEAKEEQKNEVVEPEVVESSKEDPWK
eukprot:CAMPEP_0197855578 /NCGR_PEP_ID=MMETSP1438-20131217/26905_1 /TAXON_ID=1461541 /ORGANISM="Pterosperma sp., Strain CCMP1384" /LENGTH=796 /DNA_ID=CAMNT_0043470751 /DNA_START=61 /DNA_END=2451 /DNA_ORIENTATION=+